MMLRAPGLPTAIAIAALVAAACGPPPEGAASARQAPAPPRIAASELPSLERWRHHVTDEILPFWDTPAALGTPVGNFPTFRCNDGTLPRPQPDTLCPELAQPPGWMAGDLDKDFARMKSRQTFLYGVAFHITGEERYLEYARAGVAWLREHAYEPDTGSAVTYWIAGKPGPPPDQRTAQDLAYAQVGLAFYYYLTRDPAVLADLVRLERTLMERYWQASPEPPGGMLRWVLADGDTPGEALVSQLDQIPPAFTPETFARRAPLKQHLWKNGYHVMEHALVALITTAGLTGQRLALYYAFAAAPPRARIQPYYFTGAIAGERDHPLPNHPGLHGRRVEFEAVR
jgi:hypothetical protein